MKVSEMQSKLQLLQNGFKEWVEIFNDSQKHEIRKSFTILQSSLSKIQKRNDQERANFDHSLDIGYETDMDFWGETDTMY